MIQASRCAGPKIMLEAPMFEKERCKLIPGARWDAKIKCWTAPLTWATCKSLRGVFGDDLNVSDDLAAWARVEYEERVGPATALRQTLDYEGDERLYPFQRAGVAFLKVAKQAILADEMGSGKTIQAIIALKEISDSLPILVICPNSMKTTWKREFNKWWPELEVVVCSGSAAARSKIIKSKYDVLIINWEAVRSHSKLAGYGAIALTDKERELKELNEVPWGACIADEAHRMKDPRAKQTRAVWAVSSQAKYRFALTGTPIANAPDDLWSILHFLDANEWPSRTRFIDRYCLLSWSPFGGMDVIGVKPETRAEFFDIIDARMRRMPKDLILKSLPPRVYARRYVTMPTKQARAYKQMKDTMLAQLDNDIVFATNPIAQLSRLSQFAAAYATIEDERVRLTTPSCKLDALEEAIAEADEEDQIVVFAHSRQLIDMAYERLTKAKIRCSLIVGGQKDYERETSLDDFQNSRTKVMLCTIAAGGVGITLTQARIAIFLQRSWSMVDNVQAEARVHRIGSEMHESILIVDIITEDTVEDRTFEVLFNKNARLEEIVRDKDFLRKALT